MTPSQPGTVETLAALANFFEFDLVAHRTNGLGLGADEDDALLLERLAEGCPFGEEAIAGMHGLRAGLFAGFDDLLGDEVALRSGRRADMDRLIRHLDMHGIAVGVRIDGDGGNAHLPRRLDHPAGDLAAIGDQDFLEHTNISSPRRHRLLCLHGVGPARGTVAQGGLPVDRGGKPQVNACRASPADFMICSFILPARVACSCPTSYMEVAGQSSQSPTGEGLNLRSFPETLD